MRQLRALIVISFLLGILTLSIPLNFYGLMKGIYSSMSPPPFSPSVMITYAIVFALPSITLILLAISLYYVVKKLEKVAELEIIRESGESLGRVKKVRMDDEGFDSFLTEADREVEKEDILAIDNAVLVKLPDNEFEEKEVYNETGEFLGYVKTVLSNERGEVAGILVKKRDQESEIKIDDILSVGKVIIVKSPSY